MATSSMSSRLLLAVHRVASRRVRMAVSGLPRIPAMPSGISPVVRSPSTRFLQPIVDLRASLPALMATSGLLRPTRARCSP